jgi:hypothetical protein
VSEANADECAASVPARGRDLYVPVVMPPNGPFVRCTGAPRSVRSVTAASQAELYAAQGFAEGAPPQGWSEFGKAPLAVGLHGAIEPIGPVIPPW